MRRLSGTVGPIAARHSRQVARVEGVQRGGGRRGDRGERAEQGVAVAAGVALDQVGVAEVVAGVEPDARPGACGAARPPARRRAPTA